MHQGQTVVGMGRKIVEFIAGVAAKMREKPRDDFVQRHIIDGNRVIGSVDVADLRRLRKPRLPLMVVSERAIAADVPFE